MSQFRLSEDEKKRLEEGFPHSSVNSLLIRLHNPDAVDPQFEACVQVEMKPGKRRFLIDSCVELLRREFMMASSSTLANDVNPVRYLLSCLYGAEGEAMRVRIWAELLCQYCKVILPSRFYTELDGKYYAAYRALLPYLPWPQVRAVCMPFSEKDGVIEYRGDVSPFVMPADGSFRTLIPTRFGDLILLQGSLPDAHVAWLHG